jgi:hypothetical protein
MVLLELCSLLPPTNLYSGNEINEKNLKKRIETIKLINNPQMCWVIGCLLNLDEDKRMTVKQIYQNKELLKMRKVDYYASKVEAPHFKAFEGLLSFDRKRAIGESLEEERVERGRFEDGKLDGMGLREDKQEQLSTGVFESGEFK